MDAGQGALARPEQFRWGRVLRFVTHGEHNHPYEYDKPAEDSPRKKYSRVD